MNIQFLILINFVLIIGCVTEDNKTIIRRSLNGSVKEKPVTVLSINHINDQLVITGTNLSGTTNVKLDSNVLTIITKSATELVLEAAASLAINFGSAMNLVITNAAGAAPFVVNFNAVNDSITSAHINDGEIASADIADGAITSSKLNIIGSSANKFLMYDGTNWVGSNLGSLSYIGGWDADINIPNLAGACTPGQYFIVTNPTATTLIHGISSWGVGDWVICNDSNSFEKIVSSSGVTTFAGMTDTDINSSTSLNTNDYMKYNGSKWVNAQFNESLDSLSDINLAGKSPSDVIYFNNLTSQWEPVDVNTLLTGISDTQITNLAASKLTGALPAIDGSNLTGVTAVDSSKLPLVGGTLSGDLTVNANIITTGTVDGVDVGALGTSVATNITDIATLTTAIAAKETSLPAGGNISMYLDGAKLWRDFDTSVTTSILTGYFVPVSDPGNIAPTDNLLTAIEKLEYKTDNLSIPAGTLTSITPGVGFTSSSAITTSGTLNIDTGIGANQLIKLDGSSKLPAVNGSNLTNLNGTNITSGTVVAARLPATITYLGATIESSEITNNSIINADINSAAAISWSKIDKVGATAADVSAVPLSRTVNGKALSSNITLTKSDVGLSNVLNIKDNIAASNAPTSNDDSGDGYITGSRWVDTNNQKAYICLLATTGSAVWKEITYNGADRIAINGSNAMAANLNLNNNKIINLATPIASSDAANKAYVDAAGGDPFEVSGRYSSFKHYFVSNSSYTGNLGGFAGGTTKCNSDSNALSGKTYHIVWSADTSWDVVGIGLYNTSKGETLDSYTIMGGVQDGSTVKSYVCGKKYASNSIKCLSMSNSHAQGTGAIKPSNGGENYNTGSSNYWPTWSNTKCDSWTASSSSYTSFRYEFTSSTKIGKHSSVNNEYCHYSNKILCVED